MPSVVEESKGRAKLFDTLDRAGTHFIAVGSESGSSPPSSSSCGSSGYQEEQEEGDEERAGLAVATAGGRARTKGGDIYSSTTVCGMFVVSALNIILVQYENIARCGSCSDRS